MKTIREHLEMMDEPERSKAIANVEKQFPERLNEISDSITFALYWAFNWSETDERSTYWVGILNKYESYEPQSPLFQCPSCHCHFESLTEHGLCEVCTDKKAEQFTAKFLESTATELEWIQSFERKFYSEGGWTKEDLHEEVTKRIQYLKA